MILLSVKGKWREWSASHRGFPQIAGAYEAIESNQVPKLGGEKLGKKFTAMLTQHYITKEIQYELHIFPQEKIAVPPALSDKQGRAA